MASYRPKIKLNASGETRDLPLDAETLKGKTLDYFASKSEMNSGLSSKQNNLNSNQISAVNSTINYDKVVKYDGYENKINNKANSIEVYKKAETYSQTQINTKLDSKANTSYVNSELSKKQNTLVSGTNIKTINGQSLLGKENIIINEGVQLYEHVFKVNANIFKIISPNNFKLDIKNYQFIDILFGEINNEGAIFLYSRDKTDTSFEFLTLTFIQYLWDAELVNFKLTYGSLDWITPEYISLTPYKPKNRTTNDTSVVSTDGNFTLHK